MEEKIRRLRLKLKGKGVLSQTVERRRKRKKRAVHQMRRRKQRLKSQGSQSVKGVLSQTVVMKKILTRRLFKIFKNSSLKMTKSASMIQRKLCPLNLQ